jgi:hypothetical protein
MQSPGSFGLAINRYTLSGQTLEGICKLAYTYDRTRRKMFHVQAPELFWSLVYHYMLGTVLQGMCNSSHTRGCILQSFRLLIDQRLPLNGERQNVVLQGVCSVPETYYVRAPGVCRSKGTRFVPTGAVPGRRTSKKAPHQNG